MRSAARSSRSTGGIEITLSPLAIAERTDPGVGWALGPVFEEARRCRKTSDRDAGILGRCGAADCGRSWRRRCSLSLRSAVLFLGRRLPGIRRKRRAKPQLTLRQRKRLRTADPHPSGAGGGQDKRLAFPESVSPSGCLNSAVTVRFGLWLTAWDVYFGKFSTTVSATSNTATRQRLKPRNAAPKD
jgi:hypothetical protein